MNTAFACARSPGSRRSAPRRSWKAIYSAGDLLRNPAAASLYALGIDVGGIQLIEARKALAEDVADVKDYNPNNGRPAQPEKPGSRAFKVALGPTPAITVEGSIMKSTISAILASCLLLGVASEARADYLRHRAGDRSRGDDELLGTQPRINFTGMRTTSTRGTGTTAWLGGRVRPEAAAGAHVPGDRASIYASPNEALQTNDFNGNILRWGGNYTIREFDELDARGAGRVVAT